MASLMASTPTQTTLQNSMSAFMVKPTLSSVLPAQFLMTAASAAPGLESQWERTINHY